MCPYLLSTQILQRQNVLFFFALNKNIALALSKSTTRFMPLYLLFFSGKAMGIFVSFVKKNPERASSDRPLFFCCF